MRLLLLAVLVIAALALASFFAVLSYGRFARRALGAPSTALPLSPDATRLDRLAEPLLRERPGQSGLRLVEGNLAAFAVRALTARQAERSLDLQYYIWKHDLTGRLLVNEVLRAAERGVRVRLLLDDINAQGFDRFYLALDSHPNIAVRLFNPSRNREDALRRGLEMVLRAFSVTRRMHNKAWIADGRVAVVGGRNIGDAYFDADSASNFRDLDLLMLGPAVQQAEAVFDMFWNSSSALPIASLRRPRARDLPRLRRELARFAVAGPASPYLECAQDAGMEDKLGGGPGMHWTGEARVVSDPPAKAERVGHEEWLMPAIRPLLLSAQRDLEIISPYFIPGEAGCALFREIAGRGVRIAVLTNSLAATDVTAVHGAYANYRRRLLEDGIRLFELKPYSRRSEASVFGSSGASLHTKAFTVDSRGGFVGSLNFDPRSVSLNCEMGVIFEHPQLVAEVRRVFADETSAQRSYRLGLQDGRVVWEDTRKGVQRTLRAEPEASLRRRLVALLVAWLPIESQL